MLKMGIFKGKLKYGQWAGREIQSNDHGTHKSGRTSYGTKGCSRKVRCLLDL